MVMKYDIHSLLVDTQNYFVKESLKNQENAGELYETGL